MMTHLQEQAFLLSLIHGEFRKDEPSAGRLHLARTKYP